MTDESHEMDPVEEPTAIERDDDTVLQGAGDFTSGEGLVTFAGMILLAIWVIFDVFLDEYGVGVLTLLLAALVVIAPRMSRQSVEKVLPLPVIIKVAGYTLALIGAISVIAALEGGFYDDALTIIAALAEYAAFAMAFIGARQIEI
jgi:hypothetical protein